MGVQRLADWAAAAAAHAQCTVVSHASPAFAGEHFQPPKLLSPADQPQLHCTDAVVSCNSEQENWSGRSAGQQQRLGSAHRLAVAQHRRLTWLVHAGNAHVLYMLAATGVVADICAMLVKADVQAQHKMLSQPVLNVWMPALLPASLPSPTFLAPVVYAPSRVFAVRQRGLIAQAADVVHQSWARARPISATADHSSEPAQAQLAACNCGLVAAKPVGTHLRGWMARHALLGIWATRFTSCAVLASDQAMDQPLRPTPCGSPFPRCLQT